MPFFSPYSYAGGVSRALSVFFGNSSSRRLYLRLSAVSVWPGLSPFARPSRGAPSSDCAFLLTNAAVNRRSSLAVPFSGLLTQRCMRLRSVAASFYQ